MIVGHDAYRAAVAADTLMRYERTPTEVVVSRHWPLAWERGTWAARRAGDARGAPLFTGQYAAHWVRRDDRWRIRSELFVALECPGGPCDRAVAPP